jgi:hypothetical protein
MIFWIFIANIWIEILKNLKIHQISIHGSSRVAKKEEEGYSIFLFHIFFDSQIWMFATPVTSQNWKIRRKKQKNTLNCTSDYFVYFILDNLYFVT